MSDLSTKTLSVLPVITADKGGTGVANNVAATLTRVGNFAMTQTLTGVTSVTLPTSGTLSTLSGVESLANKTLSSAILNTPVLGSYEDFTDISTPGSPAAGVTRMYTSSGNVYIKINSGTVTQIGGAITAGLLPIGAVVATFANLTGAYVCAATTVADAYGYVKCNGQTLSDGTSPMNGAVIPNINNSIFLMGSTTAGSSGGASSVTLSTANVPSHTHTYSGTASASSISGSTSVVDIQHYHQFAIGSSTTGFSAGGSGYSYNSGSQNTSLSGAGALNHSHSISGTAAGQSYSGTTDTGSGSGTSFSIVPTYISAVFVMRVK